MEIELNAADIIGIKAKTYSFMKDCGCLEIKTKGGMLIIRFTNCSELINFHDAIDDLCESSGAYKEGDS